MDRQITCINKTDRYNPHESISHIGGAGWRMSQPDAISTIESRRESFYTFVGGRRANVIVATHNGNKYLKTENDGLHPNNLLELTECS